MFKKFLFASAVTLVGAGVTSPALACGGSCGGGGTAEGCAVAASTTKTAASGTTSTRRFSYSPGMSGGMYRSPMYRGSMGRGPSYGVRDAGSKVRGQMQ